MQEWHGDDIDTENLVQPEDEAGDVASAATAKVKKLKDEIEQLKMGKQEYLDGWQRAKADYVNALKRFEREVAQAIGVGKVAAVEALLPAVDALDRAKSHADIPEGFAAIARQIENGFKTLGLGEIGKIGEKFDPALHEALGQDTVEDATLDDTVTTVLEKGYKIGDMIVRPAKVRVGHHG